MRWYWKVRIYGTGGDYAHGYVETDRDLREIEAIQNFYNALTGLNMALEGMTEEKPSSNSVTIRDAFRMLWGPK